MPKLIILRGNSGSGKTTVAEAIAKASKHKMAVVDADMYRVHMFFPWGECGDDYGELMAHNVQFCLERGYDVIWDSIFYAHQRNKKYIDGFFREHHPHDNFIFNFDISWEETARRHQSRHKKNEFSAEEMAGWYQPVESLGYDFEYAIGEDSSLEETIAFIKRICSLN